MMSVQGIVYAAMFSIHDTGLVTITVDMGAIEGIVRSIIIIVVILWILSIAIYQANEWKINVERKRIAGMRRRFSSYNGRPRVPGKPRGFKHHP
ncbi:hypothetical protein KAU08_04850 [bacterium]|nr:hypothetical protein [bacterium]